MKVTHALLAGLLLLLFGVLAGTMYETRNTKREKERGEAERSLRIEQRREADQRESQLQDSLEISEVRIREAEDKAERAERRLVWQERETAALNVTVIETNVGCPPEHIEADSLLALSNAAEKTSLREMLEASVSIGRDWEMRYMASETALVARTLECRTCREEANTWRRAANPGWFTRFRQDIPGKLLTVAATLLLVVAL